MSEMKYQMWPEMLAACHPASISPALGTPSLSLAKRLITGASWTKAQQADSKLGMRTPKYTKIDTSKRITFQTLYFQMSSLRKWLCQRRGLQSLPIEGPSPSSQRKGYISLSFDTSPPGAKNLQGIKQKPHSKPQGLC